MDFVAILLKDLIDQGYQEHKNDGCMMDYKRFFQKKFDDDDGTKYFLSIKEYDLSHNVRHGGITFSADLRIKNPKGLEIDTYFHKVEEFGLVSVEELAEETWKHYGAVHHERLKEPA